MARRTVHLCAYSALATAFLASDGKSSAVPAGGSSSEPATGHGVSARCSWGDVDGDGRLELALLSESGDLQLLKHSVQGRFEDAAGSLGLEGVREARLLVLRDYDGDGWLDLFVGAGSGVSRLFRNDGQGSFLDWTAASGLSVDGEAISAQWLDHDGDGRLDLHVVTRNANQLFRGRDGGLLEPLTLPPVMAAETISALAADVGRIGVADFQPWVASQTCAATLRDATNPTTCFEASSIPQLGQLYPLSKQLFVTPRGNVGLGTTDPKSKLHLSSRGAHCIIRLESFGASYGEAGLRFRTGQDPMALSGWEVYMDDSSLDELRDPDRLGFRHPATGVLMVLDVDGNSGKVGIGKLHPSETLDVLGNVCVSGGGMYLTCSDRRLKSDVTDLRDSLATVLELRGVRFQWRREEFPEHRFSDEQQIGFIAQEVAEVLPEVVSQGSDGYYSVDYGKLTPVLVEAIEAQQERIDGLMAANDEIRRANKVLQERVERLESVAAEIADVKATLQMLVTSR